MAASDISLNKFVLSVKMGVESFNEFRRGILLLSLCFVTVALFGDSSQNKVYVVAVLLVLVDECR